MWNSRPFIRASNWQMVGYEKWRVAKAFTDAPHCQIIEKHWSTAMQQNNIWSIAFEARAKEILKNVC